MGGNTKRIATKVHRAALGVVLGAVFFLCTASDYAYADECPSGGEHTYAAEIVLYPTEDQDGIRHYTCTKCSYSIDLPIPAVGHQWGEWVIDLEPTCTHEGHRWRECTKYPGYPHYEEEFLPPLSATGDHAYVLTEEGLPTCTAPGYRTYTCELCGEAYQEELSPLSHLWGDWTVEREPTSTEEGSRKRVCLHDSSHVEYESIPSTEEEVQEVKEDLPSAKPADPVSETPPGEPEKPSTPRIYFQFGTIDGAFVIVDVVLIAVFIAAAIPLISRLSWAQRRRAIARKKRQDKEAETGYSESVWWK